MPYPTKEYSRRYRASEKGRQQRAAARSQPQHLFSGYKRDAVRRQYKYELTREDFMSFWQKPCHYCGDAISTVGIDRIDNTKGYAVNNCVPCCKHCNRAKGELSYSDFIEKCRIVAQKHARNPRETFTAQPAAEK